MRIDEMFSRPAEKSEGLQASGAQRRPRPLVVLDVLVVLLIGLFAWWDLGLSRVDATVNWADRPRDLPAQDWLLIGSDHERTRETLQAGDTQVAREFPAGERRADLITLLHVPAGGGTPTLVVLPPDLRLAVPGEGQARRELATIYATGRPALLTRAVESFAWLRVDHFLDVDLADLVDAVGGVHVCTDQPVSDRVAGIDLSAGCHDLDGRQALGYARAHTPTALNDLPRARHQRDLIEGLARRMAAPSALPGLLAAILPGRNGAPSLTADHGDHLHHLLRLAMALHGAADRGLTAATIPMAGFMPAPGPRTVTCWDWTGTRSLFSALQNDRPLPEGLTTNLNGK